MDIGTIIVCNHSEDSRFLEKNRIYKIIDKNYLNNIRIQDTYDGEISTHYYKPSRFSVVDLQALEQWDEKEIDFSKTYITLDGRRVHLIGKSKNIDYPIIGEIERYDGGGWDREEWTINGSFFHDCENNEADLIEIKEPIDLKYPHLNITIYPDQWAIINKTTYSREVMAQIVETWHSFA